MSYNNGAKIITSGLAMLVDVANVKCFKGEPTTNLVNPVFSAWSIDGSGQASVGTRTIIDNFHCRITDVASNTRQSIFIFNTAASTTYTFSVKYRKIAGPTTLRFQLQSYNGDTFVNVSFPTTTQIGIVDNLEWQIASYNFTTGVGTNRVRWFIQDGDDYVTYTHMFELKEAQMEAKVYYTPFVSGSRGATVATGGGLFDLIRNGNNGEFVNAPIKGNDLGGSLILNGTNQSVSIVPVSNTIRTYDATVIFAIKLPVYSGAQRCILSYRGGSGGSLYIGKSSGGIYCYYDQLNNPGYTVGSMTDGRPVVVAVVMNASGATLSTYINGSLAGSVTRTGWVSTYNTVLNLGRDAGGTNEYMTGSFYYYAHYNRVLSAQEINSVYTLLKPRLEL
jgi:hypothetical protein